MCVIARALGEDVDVDAIRRQILEEHERAKQVNPHLDTSVPYWSDFIWIQ